MTLYRTRTKTQFMWLMKYLEELGCEWRNGTSLLSSIKIFDAYESDTIVKVDDKNKITYADVDYYVNEKDYKLSDIIEVVEMEEYGAMEINDNTIINADGIIWKDYDRLTINDTINHPTHYTQGEIEVIDVIKQATSDYSGFEGYLVGNIIKYVLRANYKGNKAQDLKKSQFYLNKLVEEQNK